MPPILGFPLKLFAKEGQYGLAVTSHRDVLVVVAARVPTESLLALATGSDAAHAPVWAFEVTGDVISAGEPGGHMSVRKITDNGGLL
jgi:hypothetical protein